MAGHTRRVAFWGNFGAGNLGNECTLQALAYHARRRLPAAELCCICTGPADVERRHGLAARPISLTRGHHASRSGQGTLRRLARVTRRAALELRDARRALSVMRRVDLLVMTGTGMLADASEGPLGLPYEIFKWSLAAKALRRRLLFVSVGVESIVHPLARFFIKTALRLADYRGYRDVDSRDNLVRMGFPAGNDPVYPDLAFSLPDVAPPAVTRSGERRPSVAVGLYDFLGRGAAGDEPARAYRAYVDKLCTFVVWLLERGHRVRLVLGDLTYDVPVLDDVRRQLDARGVRPGDDALADEPATSVDELLRQLAEADLVVATRFHNVLLSLLLGKPAVSVSYHRKNDALMAAMGLEHYCQAVASLDVERLVVQFRDLEKNAERVRSAILEQTWRYRDALERQYDRIFPGA